MEISSEKAAVYWDHLNAMRDDLAMTVCRVIVANDPRFPTVARFRQIYQDTLRRERLRPVSRLERPEPSEAQRQWVRQTVRKLREALR